MTRTTPKASPDASAANDAARARAIRKALQKLKNNLTSATTVDMPGNSSVAYANYASAVRSVYDEAWTLPDDITNDEEITKASVTIASDGTVISASIITPSGDANVDASVQRALERVNSSRRSRKARRKRNGRTSSISIPRPNECLNEK